MSPNLLLIICVFSDSEEDIASWLAKLEEINKDKSRLKASYDDDADSKKDYELFADESSNNSGTPIKSKTKCKSQEVTEKHTENSIAHSRKRSRYRMLWADEKSKAIEMAHKIGVKAAASVCKVPIKSLKRWLIVGCVRRKGGGRKTKDPRMEKELYSWYCNMRLKNEIITAKMIKQKAIDLSNCPDFIASKGWLDKFKFRYKLELQ